MHQDDPDPKLESQPPPFWTSIGIASALLGVLAFAISLLTEYATINAGSFFTPVQLAGVFGCLAGACGGIMACWHYANEYNVPIKLGTGALMGFLTGVGIVVVTALLGQIWTHIDPNLTQRLIASTVAKLEAMNLPEQQKQQLIDATAESLRGSQTISHELFWGVPMYGILNLITGMIGAKIFGKDEKKFT